MAEIPPPYKHNSRSCTRDFAASLDAQDPLRHFRDEFIIPSKADLKRKTLAADDSMNVAVFGSASWNVTDSMFEWQMRPHPTPNVYISVETP
jgi:hypothetical protein